MKILYTFSLLAVIGAVVAAIEMDITCFSQVFLFVCTAACLALLGKGLIEGAREASDGRQ